MWRTVLPAFFLSCALAQPGSVFEGTVLDCVTRQTIARVSITVESITDGPAYRGISNAEGRFRFEGMAAGDYRIEAMRRGYSSASALSVRPGKTDGSFRLVAGHDVTGAVIALEPEAIVTGRVVDANGDPVAGARVSPVLAIGSVAHPPTVNWTPPKPTTGDIIGCLSQPARTVSPRCGPRRALLPPPNRVVPRSVWQPSIIPAS